MEPDGNDNSKFEIRNSQSEIEMLSSLLQAPCSMLLAVHKVTSPVDSVYRRLQ